MPDETGSHHPLKWASEVAAWLAGVVAAWLAGVVAAWLGWQREAAGG